MVEERASKPMYGRDSSRHEAPQGGTSGGGGAGKEGPIKPLYTLPSHCPLQNRTAKAQRTQREGRWGMLLVNETSLART